MNFGRPPETATCTSIGKVLLGGGGQVTSSQTPGRGVLTQAFPVSSNSNSIYDEYTAQGQIVSTVNPGETYSVTAYAVCG